MTPGGTPRITDERIRTYLHSLESGNGEFLDGIRERAEERYIPVLKEETESLLRTMLALTKPERILEVGTAVGYSALLMAGAMPKTAHIMTIEKDTERLSEARENIRLAGEEGRITLLEGDAGEILAELSGSFDFIFMDAAKGQYLHWMPRVLELLAPGGLLISDNVLQEGTLALSRYAVERRERTIHARMREYLYELKHMPDIETSVLPVGDGVALSVRRE